MAGDWQTVSEKPVYEGNMKKEEDEKDVKPSMSETGLASISIGVRKRKHPGQEEEEEAGERVVKKGWGSTTRTYPGKDEDLDLDALLCSTKTTSGTGPPDSSTTALLLAGTATDAKSSTTSTDGEPLPDKLSIKQEISDPAMDDHPAGESSEIAPVNKEDTPAGILFKKRKPKNIRQK